SLARAESQQTAAKPTTPATRAAKAPKAVPVAKAPPAGTAAAPAGGAAAGAAPVAPAAKTKYGIAVASYLFDDKAGIEKDRLAGATSLEGAVVPKTDGGTTTYQVVLGSFDTRAAAEAK